VNEGSAALPEVGQPERARHHQEVEVDKGRSAEQRDPAPGREARREVEAQRGEHHPLPEQREMAAKAENPGRRREEEHRAEPRQPGVGDEPSQQPVAEHGLQHEAGEQPRAEVLEG